MWFKLTVKSYRAHDYNCEVTLPPNVYLRECRVVDIMQVEQLRYLFFSQSENDQPWVYLLSIFCAGSLYCFLNRICPPSVNYSF